ncbi:MAG: hypothetical protein CMI01_18780 [Oceanospirillaceae bacterium]|nr:hypothetical protein [Oceanospirillaceae bacterium]
MRNFSELFIAHFAEGGADRGTASILLQRYKQAYGEEFITLLNTLEMSREEWDVVINATVTRMIQNEQGYKYTLLRDLLIKGTARKAHKSHRQALNSAGEKQPIVFGEIQPKGGLTRPKTQSKVVSLFASSHEKSVNE